MKTIVSLANGADSILLVSKNNPESAAIMLKSEILSINDQGFMQTEKRVGLFKGKTADLKNLIKTYNLKEGDDFSQKVKDVKLVIKESHTPFYEGQEPKKNPLTNEEITSEGALVYRQTLVVEATSKVEDEKLITDRVETTEETKTSISFHEANQ